ncbi:conserved hypothetical protein [Gammaproteobacteria bacterium]
MSLQTQIQAFVLRCANEFKTLHGQIGNLGSLNTLNKSSLVAAINEIRVSGGTASVIDDAAPGSLATTFSASKITGLLGTLKSDILGGADAAFDTLKELQVALAADQTGMAVLADAVSNRVRHDTVQSLTATAQAQARANIGAASAFDVGDTGFDFVAVFEAALA